MGFVQQTVQIYLPAESKELAQPSVCQALSPHLSELTAKLFLAQTMNMHGDHKQEARDTVAEASGERCSVRSDDTV